MFPYDTWHDAISEFSRNVFVSTKNISTKLNCSMPYVFHWSRILSFYSIWKKDISLVENTFILFYNGRRIFHWSRILSFYSIWKKDISLVENTFILSYMEEGYFIGREYFHFILYGRRIFSMSSKIGFLISKAYCSRSRISVPLFRYAIGDYGM